MRALWQLLTAGSISLMYVYNNIMLVCICIVAQLSRVGLHTDIGDYMVFRWGSMICTACTVLWLVTPGRWVVILRSLESDESIGSI